MQHGKSRSSKSGQVARPYARLGVFDEVTITQSQINYHDTNIPRSHLWQDGWK